MTHGHELRRRNVGGKGIAGQRRIGGRKTWDNYNSIINKIYFKKRKENVLFFSQGKYSLFFLNTDFLEPEMVTSSQSAHCLLKN